VRRRILVWYGLGGLPRYLVGCAPNDAMPRPNKKLNSV
jgi:hypothetical protein